MTTIDTADAQGTRRGRLAGYRMRPRVWITLLLVIVLLAAALAIWAANGSSAATYRWATVQSADVAQTLDSYGTVTPIHQADVAFPVGGTVQSVPVKVGQVVKLGQVLATLDASSLRSSLDSARSTLATAQSKLATDTQAQASGTTLSALRLPSISDTSTTIQAVLMSSDSGGASAADGALQGAQSKLLSDQQTVDALSAAVATDLRTGQTTCAGVINAVHAIPAPTTPTAPTAPTAAPSAGASPAPPAGTPPVTIPDTSGCTDLLNKVLSDEQSVTAAQNTVSADVTALTSAVNALEATNPTPAPTPSPSPSPTPVTTPSTGGQGSGRGSGSGFSGNASSSSGSGDSSGSSGAGGSGSRTFSGGGGGSTGGFGGGGSGTAVTAEQLVVDQANVDADTADVTVAQAALKQSSLVSPLAGTVAAVAVTPGSTASAQTTAVTVIGPGVDEVTTTVSDLDLDQIKIGQDATVTPDSTNKPIKGAVTAIGLLPVSTTSTSSSAVSRSGSSGSTAGSASPATSTTATATYPITIGLQASGLYSGSGANVAIMVKSSKDVLTVPTSAVSSFGSLHSVTVLASGTATRRVVTVGTTSAARTQITSGLKRGDRVALARINEPLPTSNSLGTRVGGGFGAGAGLGGGSRRTGGTRSG